MRHLLPLTYQVPAETEPYTLAGGYDCYLFAAPVGTPILNTFPNVSLTGVSNSAWDPPLPTYTHTLKLSALVLCGSLTRTFLCT